MLLLCLLQIFLNRSFASEPLPDTDATISLPSDLEGFFSAGKGNKTRIQFHFYGSQKLFQVHKRFYAKKNTDFVSDLNLQRAHSFALAFLIIQTVTTKETTKHLCLIKDVKYNRKCSMTYVCITGATALFLFF